MGKGRHFGHININSIRNKFDEVSNFLNFHPFTAFVCTESKLDSLRDNSDTFEIENYCLVRHDRIREGGGTLFYFANDIIHTKLDLNFTPPTDCEIFAYTLKAEFIKPLIFVSIYNSPSVKKSDFLSAMENLLLFLKPYDLELIIVGDLNINLLSQDNVSHHLFCLCKEFGLWQLINSPTRFSSHSVSLLDHVYVSNKSLYTNIGTLPLGGSDHLLTYCTRKKSKSKVPNRVISGRSFKNCDLDVISSDLKTLKWDFLENSKLSSNERFDFFSASITSVLDKHSKNFRLKIRGKSLPWMSSEILGLCKRRDKALLKFKKSGLSEHWLAYKSLRINCRAALCAAKKKFFLTRFKEDCSSASVWKTVNVLRGKRKHTVPIKNLESDDGNNVEVCDALALIHLFIVA